MISASPRRVSQSRVVVVVVVVVFVAPASGLRAAASRLTLNSGSWPAAGPRVPADAASKSRRVAGV